MKNKILSLLLLALFAGQIHGQETTDEGTDSITYALYRYHFAKELSEYNCRQEDGKTTKAVSDRVLRNNLYGIYTAIIPNMQNLAGNASAFAYSHNTDKKTLNASASFQFKDSPRSFVNTGVYTEGSGPFGLYSSGSWNDNVAFNAGFSRVIGGRSQFFDPKKCEKLIPKRQAYVDSLLLAYNVSLSRSIQELTKERDAIKSILDKLQGQFPVSEQDSISYKVKQWQKLNKQIEQYKSLLKASEKEVKKQVDSELEKFDADNNILYGYSVWWVHSGVAIGNSTKKIPDSLVVDKQRVTNYPKIDVNAAVMWDRLGESTLQHAKLEGVITRGSFLDDPTLTKGKEPAIDHATDIPQVIHDGRMLGNHADLNKPVFQYTVGIYYACFFAFDKSLGLHARASLNNAFDKKYATDYQRNYSILAGPIFRAAKEDSWAKATFGINVGFQHAPFGAKAKDFFTAQAFVGVPFNAFIKPGK